MQTEAGMKHQTAMTGDDWLSDRDRDRQKKAKAKRRDSALKAAKALDKAIEALRVYLQDCRECNDGSGDERQGLGDGRHILIGNLAEYSTFLDSRYNRVGGAA